MFQLQTGTHCIIISYLVLCLDNEQCMHVILIPCEDGLNSSMDSSLVVARIPGTGKNVNLFL